MLRCREISQLVSESLEHKLPWRVRVHVAVHLLMCRFCGGFARQVRQLRRAVQQHPERLLDAGSPPPRLPDATKQRIRKALGQRESSENSNR